MFSRRPKQFPVKAIKVLDAMLKNVRVWLKIPIFSRFRTLDRYFPLKRAWTLGAGLKGAQRSCKGLCLEKGSREARKIFFSDFAENGAFGPKKG